MRITAPFPKIGYCFGFVSKMGTTYLATPCPLYWVGFLLPEGSDRRHGLHALFGAKMVDLESAECPCFDVKIPNRCSLRKYIMDED